MLVGWVLLVLLSLLYEALCVCFLLLTGKEILTTLYPRKHYFLTFLQQVCTISVASRFAAVISLFVFVLMYLPSSATNSVIIMGFCHCLGQANRLEMIYYTWAISLKGVSRA